MDLPENHARLPAPRLTMRAFWSDAAGEFLSLDRGLPYTLRRMLGGPGALVRDYVVHRDPRIVRPVRWFLIGFALIALVMQSTGFADGVSRGFTIGANAAASANGSSADPGAIAGMQWLMAKVFWVLLLTVLPATAAALASAFRAQRPSFAEMWVLCLYVAGLALPLMAPFVLFDWSGGSEVVAIAGLVLLPPLLVLRTALGYFAGPWPGRLLRAAWALALAAGLAGLLLLATSVVAGAVGSALHG